MMRIVEHTKMMIMVEEEQKMMSRMLDAFDVLQPSESLK